MVIRTTCNAKFKTILKDASEKKWVNNNQSEIEAKLKLCI